MHRLCYSAQNGGSVHGRAASRRAGCRSPFIAWRGNEVMTFSLHQANVSLEDRFDPAAFEVAENRIKVAQALYETIRGQSAVSPRDIQLPPTTALADARIVIAAFSGAGRFEVSPEYMRSDFAGLQTRESFSIVSRVCDLIDSAFRDFVPLSRITQRELRGYLHLRTEDPDFSASRFLDGLLSQSARIDPSVVGATERASTIEVRFRIPKLQLTNRLVFEESLVPEASLFVAHTSSFEEPPEPPSAAFRHAEDQLRAQLGAFGISLAE